MPWPPSWPPSTDPAWIATDSSAGQSTPSGCRVNKPTIRRMHGQGSLARTFAKGHSLPAAYHQHDVQGSGHSNQCSDADPCASIVEHARTPLRPQLATDYTAYAVFWVLNENLAKAVNAIPPAGALLEDLALNASGIQSDGSFRTACSPVASAGAEHTLIPVDDLGDDASGNRSAA